MLRHRELTRVRPLSALALTSRITNALLRSGVNSVGQLISRSREDLMAEITGLGEGSLKIIEAAVALENLALAPTETLSSNRGDDLTGVFLAGGRGSDNACWL